MDRALVLRMIAGHEAAHRRSLELMRAEGPMSSEASFAAAMELCDLAPTLEDDPIRDRERADMWRLWAKLKQPWAAKRA